MAETVAHAWVLKQRPQGRIDRDDFDWVETTLPAPGPDQVLVRTLYLSLDPTNRIWASDMDQYMPPVGLGEVMRGGTLGVVEASGHAGFAPGDVVQGMWGWQSHYLAPGGAGLTKLPRTPGVRLDAYMSVLGATGMTAYFGLLDIGKPQAGETVVVSAAAGAVGQIVGQIARLKGCRVVGTAGSDAKCRHLTEDLGFDAAINYKTADLDAELAKACPKGIDVYFENTGGPVTDAVFKLLNLNARIPLCGLIAHYNDEDTAQGTPGPNNFQMALMKRVLIKGFIIIDYFPRFPEGIAEMAGWLAAGKIKYDTDIVDGLENAVDAVNRLFDGANTGKLLVRCSPEPT
ncbi:MAG: NADP-dependent oxidoreductase [Pseudomonadales bacterium]|jgi:NADPH-dependent curcumin reductase CurA|nr:NADP-dependent oxidoreductase [Pseudomonadales bacterium]